MERTRGHRRRKLSVAAGVGVGGGEDRLSALPDDVLIHILLKIRDAPVAARTSVLARRWGRVWALLPELHFPVGTDPDRIRAALTAHDAPALRHLLVAGIEVTPEIAAAWLPIAARRLSGVLHFKNRGAVNEASAGERGTLKLPCFEKATKVVLDLHSIGLTLPPSGEFTRLTDLELARIQLHGPCSLSDVVSSPRCPSLRRLSVCSVRGLDKFTIQSESLLQLELSDLRTLQQLNVVAMSLQKIKVRLCFTNPLNQSQPVANISAPQLVTLDWRSAYDPSSVLFGEMPNLQQLATNPLFVYGGDIFSAYNHHSLMLPQQFGQISKLIIILFYLPVHGSGRFLMEEMTKLPSITILGLFVLACEHSFGAGSFHVLKMSSGIRELTLQLVTRSDYKAFAVCQSGCICAKPSNWETEDLVLPSLKEVTINGLRGTEHELALVKRLFKWAATLERVTVIFHDSITKSNDEEFRQLLLSFSRPAICMQFLHGGGSLSFD